jgi:hypothetical protein
MLSNLRPIVWSSSNAPLPGSSAAAFPLAAGSGGRTGRGARFVLLVHLSIMCPGPSSQASEGSIRVAIAPHVTQWPLTRPSGHEPRTRASANTEDASFHQK